MKVEFYELGDIEDNLLRFAVIVARYQNSWVFVRHMDRNTWEIPGGTREPSEQILETANRELYEETGALSAALFPVCIYAVRRATSGASYGLLCYADIHQLGELPDYEIDEIQLCDAPPNALTYPEIQPHLFQRITAYHSTIHKSTDP